MKLWYCLSFLLVDIILVLCNSTNNYEFPENFMIGVANSAYQSEGAWREGGKGINIWDTYVHEHRNFILDHSTGDVADDSYHLYKEDVLLLKELGVDFYRFSISWSRILPNGHINVINQEGIDYYNRLINDLKDNGITPVVTMYHWDLPQPLQDLGGWPNPIIAEYFEDYAYVLYSNFGDRVKWWITLNEPINICFGYMYTNQYAPGANENKTGYYLAAHTIVQAHVRAYRLYDAQFRQKQGGKIGLTVFVTWFEPASDTKEDVDAAERAMQFLVGLFANPVYSTEGDYPAIVKEIVGNMSKAEGYRRSRIPEFSPEEMLNNTGTYDFFGMNFYSTFLIKDRKIYMSSIPDLEGDISFDLKWPSTASSVLKVVPWGFRKSLNWFKDKYNNIPVLVTENGYSDYGQMNDTGRINYIIDYMDEMLKAIHEDGCNVIGYAYWTLSDNFEWMSGYAVKFGLYSVNFEDPQRHRSPKSSVKVFKEIIRSRKLPNLQKNEQVFPNVTVDTTDTVYISSSSPIPDNKRSSNPTPTKCNNGSDNFAPTKCNSGRTNYVPTKSNNGSNNPILTNNGNSLAYNSFLALCMIVLWAIGS